MEGVVVFFFFSDMLFKKQFADFFPLILCSRFINLQNEQRDPEDRWVARSSIALPKGNLSRQEEGRQEISAVTG